MNLKGKAAIITAVDEFLQQTGMSEGVRRITAWGRKGTPEEIGQAVVFPVSEEASFITGATLLLDGGFLAY